MHLKQRQLFITREFELQEDGLFLREKNLLSGQELLFPYEEILLERYSKRKKTEAALVIATAMFASLLSVSLLTKMAGGEAEWRVMGAMGAIVLIGVYLTRITTKREIFIPILSGGVFIMFQEKPSITEVENFLDLLKDRMHSYLKKKYGKVDRDLPLEEQLNGYAFLKDRKVIDEQEFSNLKNALLGGRSQREIGFKH